MKTSKATVSRDLQRGPHPAAQVVGQRPASGLPQWVTREFIDETIRVWQPHSKKPLTEEDAIEIIINTSALLDVLLE